MTYVMSDIHGEYGYFKEMLWEINFTDKDTLYILGDVIDRSGKGGIDILLDIMERDNVTLILGNHEEMAIEGIGVLMSLGASVGGIVLDTSFWVELGGRCTINAFNALDNADKLRIIRYLEQASKREEITVGEVDYVLIHDENDYEDYGGSVLITGHTPTRFLDDCPNPDCIWRDAIIITLTAAAVTAGSSARCAWKRAENST